MKKTSTKKKPTSKPAKPRAAKRTTPSAAARPARPPKAAEKSAAKPAEKPAEKRTAKPRGRAATHVEPHNATPAPAPVPAPALPASPARPASKTPDVDDIPGAAVNGVHFARCIRYAAKVTPKEDGEIVFAHDAEGRALVAGHDQRRAHIGFLVVGAAMHCDISVPRADACEFAKMLEGLAGPLVRIDAEGLAVIHHGVGQPPARFALGNRPITQRWEPPPQGDRPQSVGPLKIPAASQAAAVKWPSATVQSWQSADGIEFLTVTDQETGDTLARAVLAQEGRDLYPEDERQTEIPGSRTAGDRANAPPRAPKPAASPTAPSVVEAPADEATTAPGGGVTIEADGVAVAIDEEAAPANDIAAPFPSPGLRPVVVEIPAEIYDALTDAQRDALRVPGSAQVFWFVGDEVVTSASMDAASATATAALLTAAGLCCAKADPTTRHGTDVDLWAVERAPATKAEG